MLVSHTLVAALTLMVDAQLGQTPASSQIPSHKQLGQTPTPIQVPSQTGGPDTNIKSGSLTNIWASSQVPSQTGGPTPTSSQVPSQTVGHQVRFLHKQLGQTPTSSQVPSQTSEHQVRFLYKQLGWTPTSSIAWARCMSFQNFCIIHDEQLTLYHSRNTSTSLRLFKKSYKWINQIAAFAIEACLLLTGFFKDLNLKK